jgi:hypothetical protein
MKLKNTGEKDMVEVELVLHHVFYIYSGHYSDNTLHLG